MDIELGMNKMLFSAIPMSLGNRVTSRTPDFRSGDAQTRRGFENAAMSGK